MTFKIPVVDKLCKHKLLEGRNGTGIEAELFLEFVTQVLWENHISNTECGRNGL